VPSRVDAAFAYDSKRRVTLVQGGFDRNLNRFYYADLWQLGPAAPAAFVPYGSGCAGSAGTPAFSAAGQLPWLGDTFAVTVQPLPAVQPVVLFAGASDTMWNSLPLPLDLTPAGMPGCSLWASADVALPLLNTGGAAVWTLGIPNDPLLLGQSLYGQAFVLDPRANQLGAVAGDAGRVTAGGR
jgi:hypothetical protein